MKLNLIFLLHNKNISVGEFADILGICYEGTSKKLFGEDKFTFEEMELFFERYPNLKTHYNCDAFFNNCKNLNVMTITDKEKAKIEKNLKNKELEEFALNLDDNRFSPVLKKDDVLIFNKQTEFISGDYCLFSLLDCNIFGRLSKCENGLIIDLGKMQDSISVLTFDELKEFNFKLFAVLKSIQREIRSNYNEE